MEKVDFACCIFVNKPSMFSDLETFRFYLSFENALCEDYITEKFFTLLKSNIVPVVMGPPKEVFYEQSFTSSESIIL